jgi:hypothetical protein
MPVAAWGSQGSTCTFASAHEATAWCESSYPGSQGTISRVLMINRRI